MAIRLVPILSREIRKRRYVDDNRHMRHDERNKISSMMVHVAYRNTLYQCNIITRIVYHVTYVNATN